MTLPPLHGPHAARPEGRQRSDEQSARERGSSVAPNDPASRHFFDQDVTEAVSRPGSNARSRRAANLLAASVSAATGAATFFSARMGSGVVRSAIVAGIHAGETARMASVGAGLLAHLLIGGWVTAQAGARRSGLAVCVMPILPLCVTLATSAKVTSLGAKLALSALARTPQVAITEALQSLMASRVGYRVRLEPTASPQQAGRFASRCLAAAMAVFLGVAALNALAWGLELDAQVLLDTRGMEGAASGQGVLGWGEGFELEMRGETAAAVVEGCGIFVMCLVMGALAHAQGATLRLEPATGPVAAHVQQALPARWMRGMLTGEGVASLKPLADILHVCRYGFELVHQALNALYYAVSWRVPDRAAEGGSPRQPEPPSTPRDSASSSADIAFEFGEQPSSTHVHLHPFKSPDPEAKQAQDKPMRAESVGDGSDFDPDGLPRSALRLADLSASMGSTDRTPESWSSQSTSSRSESSS